MQKTCGNCSRSGHNNLKNSKKKYGHHQKQNIYKERVPIKDVIREAKRKKKKKKGNRSYSDHKNFEKS